MTVISVKIPDGLLDGLAWLVESGYYISRSDAIRAGIHLLFKQDLAKVVATGTPKHPLSQSKDVKPHAPRRFTPAELSIKADPSLDLRKAGAGWGDVIDAVRG